MSLHNICKLFINLFHENLINFASIPQAILQYLLNNALVAQCKLKMATLSICQSIVIFQVAM